MRSAAQILLVTSLLLVTTLPAQAAEEVLAPEATAVAITGSNILSGHIIATTDQNYTLSQTPYDQNIVGVVVSAAAVTLTTSDVGDYLLATSGQVTVLVNNHSGAIHAGDFIAASDTPGEGMKAINPGIVLGQAKADMTDAEGSVPVDINIQFYTGPETATGGPSFSQLGSGFFSVFDVDRMLPMSQPIRLIKTILAALIAMLTIYLCFKNFGRIARSGIEAAGRNPLAGRLITGSIILNVVFTVITGVVGLGLAYLIFVV